MPCRPSSWASRPTGGSCRRSSRSARKCWPRWTAFSRSWTSSTCRGVPPLPYLCPLAERGESDGHKVKVAPMPDKNRIEVEILGHKYTIRSEATPEYVRELAAHVEQRAREIQSPGPSQDPVKLLALAALYITDELFRLRDERALADNDTSARLGALSQLLDAAAPPAT